MSVGLIVKTTHLFIFILLVKEQRQYCSYEFATIAWKQLAALRYVTTVRWEGRSYALFELAIDCIFWNEIIKLAQAKYNSEKGYDRGQTNQLDLWDKHKHKNKHKEGKFTHVNW